MMETEAILDEAELREAEMVMRGKESGCYITVCEVGGIMGPIYGPYFSIAAADRAGEFAVERLNQEAQALGEVILCKATTRYINRLIEKHEEDQQ